MEKRLGLAVAVKALSCVVGFLRVLTRKYATVSEFVGWFFAVSVTARPTDLHGCRLPFRSPLIFQTLSL